MRRENRDTRKRKPWKDRERHTYGEGRWPSENGGRD